MTLLVIETLEGRPPSVETSWGGFGGGRGGWRFSPALVFLVGALFFGGLFVIVIMEVIDSPEFHAWTGVTGEESGDRDEDLEHPPSDEVAETADEVDRAEGTERAGSTPADETAD